MSPARQTTAAPFFTPSRRLLFGGLSALLLGVVVWAICSGAIPIPPAQVVAILLGELGISSPWEFEAQQRAVVVGLRLPRVVLGVFAGATLAVAGAALQGLFRNPLADPALIGVSGGAALAAVAFIVLGHGLLVATPPLLRVYLLPVSAFLGGLAAVSLVYRVGTVNGRTMVIAMLLAGIAVNAICNAMMGLLIFVSDDQQLRDLTFWTLGSLSRNTWDVVLPVLPFMLLPLIGLPLLARALNAYVLGESEAGHLGYNVESLKKVAIALTTLGISAAVALTGVIAFVGLVVPHLVRLLVSADHRCVLPGSILLGAALMLVADIIARTAVAPAELPVGVVTSCIGGPFFLWLLMSKRVIRGL